MYIFEVEIDYGEYTAIVTEDITKVLDESVLTQLGDSCSITVWLDGKVVEEFRLKDNEASYDEIYLKIIKYENKKEND